MWVFVCGGSHHLPRTLLLGERAAWVLTLYRVGVPFRTAYLNLGGVWIGSSDKLDGI